MNPLIPSTVRNDWNIPYAVKIMFEPNASYSNKESHGIFFTTLHSNKENMGDFIRSKDQEATANGTASPCVCLYEGETEKILQTEDHLEDQISKQRSLCPPDGGWGWLVTMGCFVNTTMTTLLGSSFSIIFLRFLLDLEASSALVAWIINLEGLIFNLMGLVAGPLTHEFGDRPVAMIGALLASLALISSAFAPSAKFLYFSFGILGGIGSGISICLSLLIVPKYFEKRRGRANSIVMAGFCIGVMIWPPMTRYFVDKYGFRGGALLVGSVLLNGCVAAVLFHPVSWHMKVDRILPISATGKREKTDTSFIRPTKSNPETRIYSASIKRDKENTGLISHSKSSSVNISVSQRIDGFSSLEECVKLDLRKTVASYTAGMVQTHRKSTCSKLTLQGHGSSTYSDPVAHNHRSSFCYKLIGILGRVLSKMRTNMKILRVPNALIISLSNTFYIPGHYNFIIMVPFAMQSSGHSLELAAWCLSISGVCNLITRMVVNNLTDVPWFNVKKFYVASLASVSLCCFLFPLVNDLTSIMILMGLWGCGIGASMGIYGQIMIAVVGKENFEACFGSTCLLVGFGYITLGPLIGYIRDISTSYVISMWVSACLISISCILWLFMPCAISYDKQKEDEAQ